MLPALGIALIALLYAAVGHGGASGYLALMALMGEDPQDMRTTALWLNLLVSAIATVEFMRSGNFRWSLFLPLILLSMPMAFLGASIVLDARIHEQALAGCLVLASWRLFRSSASPTTGLRPARPLVAVLLGGGIGLVSGIVGIGGGVLLSPALLLMRWCDARGAASVSAPFILVNSAAGLMGLQLHEQAMRIPLGWLVAAFAGGVLGSAIGSRVLPDARLRQVLGVVLLLASTKLLLP